MKYSTAARNFISNIPIDGHLQSMESAIADKVKGAMLMVDVDHDISSGEDILKLVVFLPQGRSMDDVYCAASASDKALAACGVNFYIAEGV